MAKVEKIKKISFIHIKKNPRCGHRNGGMFCEI